MPDKQLPARPNLEQYKKQAKDLAREFRLRTPDARARVQRYHPRFAAGAGAPGLDSETREKIPIALTDAQLVIAREHGFESWPRFAAHITTLNLERSVAGLDDPAAAFIRAACVPRDGSHASGTLEEAELILARYPRVARADIYASAILADEEAVRNSLQRDPASAHTPGGTYNWDPLTYLCFSRYLRLDRARSDAFVRTARALLEAGANANTGWIEMIDHPNPRPILESVIYGAAGIARHEGLTRLLLEHGADPNDEETPYHAAEGYDLAVLKALLESGKLDGTSMTTLLLRKADWHDTEGIRMLLQHGADPNAMTRWGHTALHQALRRDNRLVSIALLLDHGADPALKNIHNGMSAVSIAARRGRGDVLRLFEERGVDLGLTGVESLIAACAKADDDAIRALTGGTGAPGPGSGGPGSPRTGPGPWGGGLDSETWKIDQLIAAGGTLLAEFAGNGNTEGVRRLLDLGVDARALHGEGDGYWDITRESTALHVAAWRGWPGTVKMLIERGARVNALDGKGRTALQLAVKACVDSYWTDRRTPGSVESLLNAGATIDGIEIPCGYDEVDELLLKARETRG